MRRIGMKPIEDKDKEKKMNKAEIVAKLRELGIEFDEKSTRDDLAELLPEE